MADESQLSRQRLDYIDKPDGSTDAVLTISLPGGVVKRFVSNVKPNEAEKVSGEIVGAELMLNPEVGVSVFKKIGRLAKKVASSKVFALAAKGLAFAAPLLGPLGPAALGAAAGLGVAAKLAKAGVAAAHGAKTVAKQLTASAHNDAKRLTRTPAGAAQLMAAANKKRLGAEKIADKGKENPTAAAAAAQSDDVAPVSRPAAVSRPATRPAAVSRPARVSRPAAPPPPAPEPMTALPALPPAPSNTEADVLARARAGRVRSNDGAPVSSSELIEAHRQGRIFWIQ